MRTTLPAELARAALVTAALTVALTAASCQSVPTGDALGGADDAANADATVASRLDDGAGSDPAEGAEAQSGVPHGSATGELGIVAEFFGQDGAGHAGLGCSTDSTQDNIRIRLSRLPMDQPVAGYEVDDYTGSGLWVDPCNDVNWFLVPLPAAAGVVDLFMKPHRDAPEGTPYRVTVSFEDGTTAAVEVVGGLVLRDVAAGPTAEGGIRLEFLGQDGEDIAGEACTDGSSPDNIHIRISDLPADRDVAGYQVDDYVGGGRWVHPCNGENWWIVPREPEVGVADLFIKPHLDSPDDTEYIVTVFYADGTHHRETVVGTAVTADLESTDSE